MIQSEELGMVITENEEESAWYNYSEDLKQQIKVFDMRIKRAQRDLKMSAREIEKKFKDGARRLIKEYKKNKAINKKVLKFAESHLKKKV